MSQEEFLKVRTKPYKKTPSETSGASGQVQTAHSAAPFQPKSRKIKTTSTITSVSAIPPATMTAAAAIPSAVQATAFFTISPAAFNGAQAVIKTEMQYAPQEETTDSSEREEDSEPVYLPIGIVER